jgi:hypothetical protein
MFVCLVKAVLANEVPVVVNCYDQGSTICICCKSDLRESSYVEEFVRI